MNPSTAFKHLFLLSMIHTGSSLSAAPLLPEPPPQITTTSDAIRLDWHGTEGVTYFVEYSSDLIHWKFAPVIKSGSGEALQYPVTPSNTPLYYRLKFTNAPSIIPREDDFDGDGISNWNEIKVNGSGTNPLLPDSNGDGASDYQQDSNGNGLQDGWELLYGSIGQLASNEDTDGDSLSNMEESLMGSNPFKADTDGDGVSDAEESVWWDSRITWPRTPEPHYSIVELTGHTPAAQHYATAWNFPGKVRDFYTGAASDPSFLQRSMEVDATSQWNIVALSNAGHVLVVEDHRISVADSNYTLNNASVIPNSINNWVWDPATATWWNLENQRSNEGQTLLAMATDISQSGSIVGFAWVPLADATGEATSWPGIEKIEVLWASKDSQSVQLLRTIHAPQTAKDFVPYTDASTPYHNLIELPNVIIAPRISDHDELLTCELNPHDSAGSATLKKSDQIVEEYAFESYPDESLAYMTRTGELFYKNASTGDITLQAQIPDGEPEPIVDGDNKPEKIIHAVKATLTSDASDMLALTPALWVRDHNQWKKLAAKPDGKLITAQGSNQSGLLLAPNGQSLWLNGKEVLIESLVSTPSWSNFNIAQINDSGIMVGRAEKNDDEKIILLIPTGAAVDANRDGEVRFNASDRTEETAPYTFWVNADHDLGHSVDLTDWEEDDLYDGIQDALEPGLHSGRDMEDLTRIWLNLKGAQPLLGESFDNVILSVKLEPLQGTPQLNLFQSQEPDGGREYLKNINVGWHQYHDGYENEIVRLLGSTSSPGWIDLPHEELVKASNRDGKVYLLLEGAKSGKAKLTFRLQKGNLEIKLPPIYIDLKHVTDMYETWTVGDVESPGVDWANTFPSTKPSQTTGQTLPLPQTPSERDYILFVHGWNMSAQAKESFASTMFKRLWHQGYRGRFGSFRWPTFHGLSWNEFHTAHYDGSEHRAWFSATGLANLVTERATLFKDPTGKSLVRVYAHSMGNVVASESLRQQAPIHTYISAQAAIPAHVWDNTTPRISSSPTTPNLYGYYWQPGARLTSDIDFWKTLKRPSYMAPQYMPSTPRYINHFNPDDWALNATHWQLNQKLKPDNGYQYEQLGLSGDIAFTHNLTLLTEEILTLPEDRFEIFSFATESRSLAMGAEGATSGMFDPQQSVNLQTSFDFEDAHKGHSAQFRSTIQKRWRYWSRTLTDMQTLTP